MSKSTPGPWKYVPERLHKGQHVAGRGPEVIIGDMAVRFRPERDADALLTRATPDLLEILKDLCSFETELTQEKWDRARAVIAKAEGKDND